MALPVTWTLVKVYGTYLNRDGTPATGTVTFKSTQRIVVDGVSVLPKDIVATLNAVGYFEVMLPSSNDPDLNVTGWAYSVDEQVSNARRRIQIVVPYDADPINMALVGTAVPVEQLVSVVGLPAVMAAEAARDVAVTSATTATDAADSAAISATTAAEEAAAISALLDATENYAAGVEANAIAVAADALTATTKAGEAAASANTASTAATTATTKAAEIVTSANAAAISATNAATSATTATTQSNLATAKAAAATISETNANASAVSAANSVTTAQASAQAAATSATNAATSATTATNAAAQIVAQIDTAANDAEASATAAAASAEIAANSLLGEYGVSIVRDAGITDGGYPAARSVRKTVTMQRFFAEVYDGSATVWVKVNDVAVHGPVAVAAGTPVTQVINLTIPQGANITFEVVAVGVTRLWSQIDGGAL